MTIVRPAQAQKMCNSTRFLKTLGTPALNNNELQVHIDYCYILFLEII